MLQRKTLQDNMSSYPQKILIDALKKAQIPPKKKMPGNVLLWIVLILIGLYLIYSIIQRK